ncbi:MAG: HlyD family efflux transporter periplasmic adaptor subunit [Pseudanabaenaceae cyanobacterium]
MDAKSKEKGQGKGRLGWLPIALAAGVGLGSLAGVILLLARWREDGRSAVMTSSAAPVVAAAGVGALGRLEPGTEVVRVAAPSTLGMSRVAELRVAAGDTVTAGQVLAKLDGAARTEAEIARAAALVALREQELRRVQAGAKAEDLAARQALIQVRRALQVRLQGELAIAQADLARYEALAQNGAIAPSTLDGFRLRVVTLEGQIAQAAAEVAATEKEAQSLATVRTEDVAIAEAQLASAQAELARAKVERQYTEVRAPFAGQVVEVLAQPGEAVGSSGLVALADTQNMYAIAEVAEEDIGRVRVGQRAIVENVNPNRPVFAGPLTGTVERIGLQIAKNDVIGTDPATRTDVRVVEVRIRLDRSEPVAALTNLQVRVRIQTDSQT